jgi:hypothetical protein
MAYSWNEENPLLVLLANYQLSAIRSFILT